jgi:hypothetical protein
VDKKDLKYIEEFHIHRKEGFEADIHLNLANISRQSRLTIIE